VKVVGECRARLCGDSETGLEYRRAMRARVEAMEGDEAISRGRTRLSIWQPTITKSEERLLIYSIHTSVHNDPTTTLHPRSLL
jgi:hypothetical protein